MLPDDDNKFKPVKKENRIYRYLGKMLSEFKRKKNKRYIFIHF